MLTQTAKVIGDQHEAEKAEEHRVEMAHGAGGRAALQLVEELFLPALDIPALRALDDGAEIEAPPGQRLVLATDGHVVSPLFFPGGDIG